MSWTEIIVLILAGAAGGGINAIAGGGTLVTFPALLLFGTPAIVANATNTLALVVGTSGSLFGYRKHLPSVRPWLWRFIPVSIVGSIIGAFLLTRTSNETFKNLVPFLILFATILFTLQGPMRRWLNRQSSHVSPHPAHAVAMAVGFQFLVGIYGGYFGAGIGILMLAALGFMGLTDIHEMNTLKTILSSLINLVAAVWFVCAGLIDWPKAAVVTGGALVGYYLGAHYSQKISQQQLRRIITGIGFGLSVVTFYKQFVK